MIRRWHSLAGAALLLLVSSSSSSASGSCATRAEAKAASRGAFLYWHRGPGGIRCWSTRRAAQPRPHHARRAAPIETAIEAAPAPVPSPLIPHGLLFPQHPAAPLPIPPEATAERSIVDFSPWHWSSEAYAASPGPIVMPAVNRANKSDKATSSRLNADALMVLVAILLVCFLLGSTLYRWIRQRDLLRI